MARGAPAKGPHRNCSGPPPDCGCTHTDPPHLRALSCCKSEPECPLCPLLPQNAHRSLKELAAAGLYANVRRSDSR